MAALTANRDTKKMGLSAVCDAYEVPVKTGVKLWAGGIGVVDAGYAAPGRTATGLIAAGRIEREYATSTANGQFKVFIRPGIFPFGNSSAGDLITQADVGSDCFIVDDQTVAKTNGTSTRSRAGKVIQVDADGVWVQLGIGVLGDAMDVTAKLVREQGQAISFLFNQGFSDADTFFGELTTVIQSNSRQQFYGFLDSQPVLREWIGPRVVQNVKATPFSIENKKFEGTISVLRDDFEDDNLGQYNIIAQQLGQAAAEKPDDLVSQLLLNGEAGLGYDGQEFFDQAHPVGGGSGSNLITAKPLTVANYNAVRATMRGRQMAGGRSVRVRPNLLIVPPELEAQALEIVAAETTASGATNVNKGTSKVLVIDDLSLDSPTSWYLADTTKPVKPMIYQQRRAPRVVAKTSVTDDNVFSLDEYIWGVDMRGNAGYGPWYLITKVKAA